MTASHSRPVVITRPLAQAAPLADRITAIGREAVVFPLLEIQPLPDPGPLVAALRDVGRYAMVAFVSPNAIDAAFAHVERWPAGVALAVVGEGSKAALARHGLTPANATIFSPADSRRTDSQTLLQVLDLAALRGKTVLILRGETGRELLADALRDAGVLVDQVAAYRRLPPRLDADGRERLRALLRGGADWVITSSEALRILMQMVRETEGETAVVKMQQQRLVVPHVRIAETARELGFTDIIETGSGDEPLVAALQFQA